MVNQGSEGLSCQVRGVESKGIDVPSVFSKIAVVNQ